MIGRNFHHCVKTGLAVPPISLSNANTTATSVAIVEPWNQFRQLSFLLIGGIFATSGQLTATVQGRLRSDHSTWAALKDKNGDDLVFPAAKIGDGDALENGLLLGTLPLRDVDAETYEAVRLVLAETATAACLVGAAYVLSDPHAESTGQADELFALLH